MADVKKALAEAGVRSVIDDLKRAENEVKDVIVSTRVTEVGNEALGCDCGGWHLSVHKLRIPISPAQPTIEESLNTESK